MLLSGRRHRIHGADGTAMHTVAPPPIKKRESAMAFVLWIIAALLVISGIFAIFRKQLLWGIVLIVVGCLVGPGGVSIFT